MKFPYRQYQVNASATIPSGVLRRPEVLLRVVCPSGGTSLWAMVDTGSDEILLPVSVAKKIGAVLQIATKWQIKGIAGQVLQIVLGDVKLQLSDGNTTFIWPAKIGFVDFANPQDEVAVLGRAGFLEYFRVVFDGYGNEIEIDVTPNFPGKVN